MAEDEEEERQGPRPANDNGSPNGMSLDPRILRIACSRNRNPLTSEGESAIPCPHGCKPPQRTSKPPRIGPLATTSKRPVRFGNPMLSASSPVKMPAKWPATSLAFSPCCASGHAESGSGQDAESLRQLRHPHGGSVEDHARVRRQKIKCSLDAELICSLERGLIQ
jgi:hypothetical protein